jgi:hypothetical protein
VNRSAVLLGLVEPSDEARLAGLFTNSARRYRLSLVTNARAGAPEAIVRNAAVGSNTAQETPLNLSWPPQVYSLSHLAVPFRMDDPLFGLTPDTAVSYGVRLGLLAPRGEKGELTLSLDQLMRLNCNPFFPYVEERIGEVLPK